MLLVKVVFLSHSVQALDRAPADADASVAAASLIETQTGRRRYVVCRQRVMSVRRQVESGGTRLSTGAGVDGAWQRYSLLSSAATLQLGWIDMSEA